MWGFRTSLGFSQSVNLYLHLSGLSRQPGFLGTVSPGDAVGGGIWGPTHRHVCCEIPILFSIGARKIMNVAKLRL